jgi:LytS/YehU family sensor histidine kinase
MTLALLPIDRKLASTQQSIGALALKFLLLSIPFSIAHVYLAGLLYSPFPAIYWSPLRNSDFAVYYFIGGWVTYFAVVGILQAFRFYNRFVTGQLQLERIERSLVESRLSALRLHLEPHFLFNTLNAISSKATANQEVQDMIGDLGALLRHSLDCKDKAQITVAEELELLQHYVSIQKARFGDRFDIRIDADSEILSAMVPSMLLQPLVENAIRHGLEDRLSGGSVEVSVAKLGKMLKIEVVDDGVGLPESWELETSGGHGLSVTRERLRAMYPDLGEHCLTIRRRERGGTSVRILVPLHRGETAHHAIG